MLELKPCYHKGEDHEYIVCDRCFRKWNTEVDRLESELSKYKEREKVLVEAWEKAIQSIRESKEIK